MKTAWLIDGVPGFSLPLDDRGFAYGDGVFETIAAPNAQPRRFSEHYLRLRSSCERLDFAAPAREALESDIQSLSNDGNDCVIKIIVTRGSGGRGYRPPAVSQPRRIVGVFPWPHYPIDRYLHGIRVVHCDTRISENAALAGMKHLCRLEQVLGQQEVARTGADEGIMRTADDRLVSGTMSNLFLASDSRLITPSVDRCGVAGIMRAAVISTALDNGIEVSEQHVDFDMLNAADELFLTNSVFGIWPITVLDDIAFSLGRLTQWLMNELGVYPRR